MRTRELPRRLGHGFWVWRLLLPALGFTLAAAPAGTQSFDLDWHTVDCGGGQSAGGGFVLVATVGQPDSREPPASGGPYSLSGGVWPGIEVGEGGGVFADGFESGDTSAWSATLP